jgi:hypothetical protein
MTAASLTMLYGIVPEKRSKPAYLRIPIRGPVLLPGWRS